jgi:hypothetical protein
MNIVGFGDSFIMQVGQYSPNYPHVYMNLIGKHFDVETESRGLAGSGPWNMFFDFMKYDKPIDVAIIAWSEISRLYHPVVQPLNTHNCLNTPITESNPFKEVYEAARDYYKYVSDHNHEQWEMKALMIMFDEFVTKQHPNTKFIHMPCFSWYSHDKWWGELYDKIKPEEIVYHHDFKNGMEIRPCLMYVSKNDDYPKNILQETRENHITLKTHRQLADAIIHSIENYTPGKITNLLDYGFNQ